MAEVIVFPDAVALLRTHLLTISAVTDLVGSNITGDVPADRPATFIQLTRTGGISRDLVVDDPQVTVDSWAATQASAMHLAQLVRAHLHAIEGTVLEGVAVYGVAEVSGPVDLPDPDSQAARVRQTFQIGLRGQPQ